MKTIEYKTKDKSAWGDGKWQSEPDKIQFTDEDTGFPCLIVRPHGALCGYAGVNEKHPFFGKRYDEVDIDVHGGLTFSDRCMTGITEDVGVCHKVEDGEDDKIWWFGFDCAHYQDVDPSRLSLGGFEYGGTYKDVDFVKAEIAGLAKQLKEAA